MRRTLLGTILILVFYVLVAPVASQSTPFFEGKTMTLIVSFPPGGGYDIYARMLARHMPRHIPGKPKILVQNMLGAGGVIAANYLAKIAKADGLFFGILPREIYLLQMAGVDELKADFRKMIPLGSLAKELITMYVRTATGYTSMQLLQEAIRRGQEPLPVGSTGLGSTGYIGARIIEEVVGEKLFKIVLGYRGGAQIDIAVRKGELAGASRSLDSLLERVGDLLEEGKITIIVQSGTEDGKRSPRLPQVPSLWEFVRDSDGESLLKGYIAQTVAGRPFWLPPGVPEERVATLRAAFSATFKDPEFLADAKKSRRPITPMSGRQVAALYEEAVKETPSLRNQWKEMLGK